jgi:dihydrofolate reductase
MSDAQTVLWDRLLREFDIRAIAAMAENRVIGNENRIPWHIPEEMEFFQKTTRDASVLMGRRTFESIGHPLPGRQNIVMTRNRFWTHDNVIVIQNLEQLLNLNIKNPIWVCGGAAIYQQLFPACRELLLSVVAGEFCGNTKLPDFDEFFVKNRTLLTCPAFTIDHYVSRKFSDGADANL